MRGVSLNATATSRQASLSCPPASPLCPPATACLRSHRPAAARLSPAPGRSGARPSFKKVAVTWEPGGRCSTDTTSPTRSWLSTSRTSPLPAGTARGCRQAVAGSSRDAAVSRGILRHSAGLLLGSAAWGTAGQAGARQPEQQRLAAARTCVVPQHAIRHHTRQHGALCQVGTQRAQHERQIGMAARGGCVGGGGAGCEDSSANGTVALQQGAPIQQYH